MLRPRRMSMVLLALLLAAPVGLLGCGSNRLETGYRVRPLNSSRAEQRAFYAGPFSPEAREAQRTNAQLDELRRERPGD